MKFSEIAGSMLAAAGCAMAVPCGASVPAAPVVSSNDVPSSSSGTQEPLRNIIYFDQWHPDGVQIPADKAAGVTHVVMSFANSSIFLSASDRYTPFMPVADVRKLFPSTTKVGIALGGWGDTAGFGAGSATADSRALYAANIRSMVDELSFDFVDIDWEYPGGNGADYLQTPNSEKTAEIEAFPQLLQAIKVAIAPRPLSIAAPAKADDMIAYTAQQAPAIAAAVDWINVMTYDLINRRDNVTAHHSDVAGSLAAIQRFIDIGIPASKINLGFAFYAKYFQTQDGYDCSQQATGCPLAPAELADGSDAGTSGAMTFESANVNPPPVPDNLTVTPNGACGRNTGFTCAGLTGDFPCCSASGYCGATDAYCMVGCQEGYGECRGPPVGDSFIQALANGKTDETAGGQWWWDQTNKLFWTFETPELIARKFDQIVSTLGLGGGFAWSLGEDTYDWSHVGAISNGVAQLNAARTKA